MCALVGSMHRHGSETDNNLVSCTNCDVMIPPNDSPKKGGLPGAMAATRRLAAILAADVAGYSRLMGADEEGTLERLKTARRQLIDPKITEHHGRIVKTTGDGLLVELASVVDAVRCAAEVQRGMIDREPEVTDERQIRFRVGVNLEIGRAHV